MPVLHEVGLYIHMYGIRVGWNGHGVPPWNRQGPGALWEFKPVFGRPTSHFTTASDPHP